MTVHGNPEGPAVAALLELVASERPDYLEWAIDVLQNSPVRFAILDLFREWETADPEALVRVIVKASADLDRLERRRSWRKPDQVIHEPHLAALYQLVGSRAQRVEGIARRRRLEIIRRKLKRVYDRERAKKELEAFLREPPRQEIDPAWIRAFLRRPAEEG